jgi:tetratricopeptide (TPR) repeat protein
VSTFQRRRSFICVPGAALAAVLIAAPVLGGGCSEPTPPPTLIEEAGLSAEDARRFVAARQAVRSDQSSRFQTASSHLTEVLRHAPQHPAARAWWILLGSTWAEEALDHKRPAEARHRIDQPMATVRAVTAAQGQGVQATAAASRLLCATADWLRVARRVALDEKLTGKAVPTWASIEAQLDRAEALGAAPACVAYVRGALTIDRGGDADDAAEHFEAAAKGDPAFFRARYRWALALEAAGNRRQAQWEMKRIINDNPAHAGAERFLIEIAKGPAPAR